MCALICEPSPSTSRPPDSRCRSYAEYAIAIGVRAKATATEVPSSIRSVAVAASARATNGSCAASVTNNPRTAPLRSASRAIAAIRSGPPWNAMSTAISPVMGGGYGEAAP